MGRIIGAVHSLQSEVDLSRRDIQHIRSKVDNLPKEINNVVGQRLVALEARVSKLETWRSYLLGAVGVLGLMVSLFGIDAIRRLFLGL